MAITKLWSRRADSSHSSGSIVSDTIDYACNQDKTKNISYTLIDSDFIDDAEAVSSVLRYAVNENKTTLKKDEFNQIEEVLVSGINCRADKADEEFMQVKEFWNKTDKNLLWHGTQSFKPGEIDPKTAHEIGMKLAQKMWGDKYQIVVTTHCDKEHIHNHFVVNSVSFIDGKKYHYSNSEIYRLRNESDKLCVDYGLSVIKNPKDRGSSYYEWLNSDNKKTVRALIKEDIDLAIENSLTLREVFLFLERNLGYEVKTTGKYITLKPPGKEKSFRLNNLDNNRRNSNKPNRYTEEAIVERLKGKESVNSQPYNKQFKPTYKSYHTKMKYNCFDALDFIFAGTSIRGLYWHYFYMLKNMNLIKTKYPQHHFEIRREAQRKIQAYSKQIQFISKNKINSFDDLNSCENEFKEKLSELEAKRAELRYNLRFSEDVDKQNEITKEIAQLNLKITGLRTDYKLCRDIKSNSEYINSKLEKLNNEKENQDERKYNLWQQKMQ